VAALEAVEQAERWARALAASRDEGKDFGAQYLAFGRELQDAQALLRSFLQLAGQLAEPEPPDLAAALERLAAAVTAANDRAEVVLSRRGDCPA
jgi:hypothetical protein